MKNILLPFLLLSICPAFAQELKPKAELAQAKVYLSKLSDRESGLVQSEFVTESKGKLITMSTKKGVDNFVVYDENLKPIKRVAFEHSNLLEDKQVLTQFEFLRNKGNTKAARLYGVTDGKAKINQLFIAPFDVNSLSLGNGVELSKVEGEEFYADFHNAFTGASYSPDSSKIVIAQKLPSNDKGRFQIRIIVLDGRTLEIKWTKDFVLDQPDRETRIHGESYVAQTVISGKYPDYKKYTDELGIDNNGDVYTWLRLDKGRSSDFGRFEIMLICMQENGLQSTTVDFGDNQYYNGYGGEGASMTIMENGCAIAAIWADNEGDKYDKDGMSLTKWTVGSNSKTIFYTPSEEIWFDQMSSEEASYQKKQKAKNGKIDLETYHPDKLLGLKDNRILLITNSGFVTLFDSNLSPVWEAKIRYGQDFENFTEEGMSGLRVAFTDSNLHFILNDHINNTSRDWRPVKNIMVFRPWFKEDFCATAGSINLYNPNMRSRQKMWSADKIGGYFAPLKRGHNAQFGNRLYFYIQGGKKTERIVRVDLE